MFHLSEAQASATGQSRSNYASSASSDMEMSSSDEESPFIVSPAKLRYKLGNLSGQTRAKVQDLFREPPTLALEKCRQIGNTYAFQMTERVSSSVRISAARQGAERSTLTCSCDNHDAPCKHVVWLLDQVARHALYNYDPRAPLSMRPEGYAENFGDPYVTIAEYHLDILADDLNCYYLQPDSNLGDVTEAGQSKRAHEAQELLDEVCLKMIGADAPSAMKSVGDDKDDVNKRNALQQTMLKMLVNDDELFHHFASQRFSDEMPASFFQRLKRRADLVLAQLLSSEAADAPGSVGWAAHHLRGILNIIRTCILSSGKPMSIEEIDSAADVSVHVLKRVTVHQGLDRGASSSPSPSPSPSEAASEWRLRSLYANLLGDRDNNFALDVLIMVPEAASSLVSDLDAIYDGLGQYGAPATYVNRFQQFLAHVRASGRGGWKRMQRRNNERAAATVDFS